MAFQCRSVPLMLFFLTRLRRRLHFFDIWPCKFTPATLFRIYIHLSPPPHPLLCLNPPHPTPFLFSFRICKWLQTVRAMLMYRHKKKAIQRKFGYKSPISSVLYLFQANEAVKQKSASGTECSQGDWAPPNNSSAQEISICVSVYRTFPKISGCDKPPRCSCTSRLGLVILKTTQMICKIHYQSFRVEQQE